MAFIPTNPPTLSELRSGLRQRQAHARTLPWPCARVVQYGPAARYGTSCRAWERPSQEGGTIAGRKAAPAQELQAVEGQRRRLHLLALVGRVVLGGVDDDGVVRLRPRVAHELRAAAHVQTDHVVLLGTEEVFGLPADGASAPHDETRPRTVSARLLCCATEQARQVCGQVAGRMMSRGRPRGHEATREAGRPGGRATRRQGGRVQSQRAVFMTSLESSTTSMRPTRCGA